MLSWLLGLSIPSVAWPRHLVSQLGKFSKRDPPRKEQKFRASAQGPCPGSQQG